MDSVVNLGLNYLDSIGVKWVGDNYILCVLNLDIGEKVFL